MNERVWENPEIKNVILKIIVAAFIFIIIALFYFIPIFEGLNKGIIDKNISVMGLLIKEHPEYKEDIITAFTKKADTDDIKDGIEAAREYGYTSDMPMSVMPVISEFYLKGCTGAIVIPILCFATSFILIYAILKKIYKKVRDTATAAEMIVEGDFNIKLDEESEGDFSKLGHEYNQMAKRLEQTLERLKNEKIYLKNIISDISHQLKTPLSSIKIFNEILLTGKAKDMNDQTKFLVKTNEQIERMEWLIQNLLVMARIEAGAIDFTNEDKPLYPTIEMVIESLADKWKSKNQSIKIINNNEEEIYLLHDEKWLGEAISNIIKNAIEHTGLDGSVQIELSKTTLMTRIKIIDNGEGISSEDLPHIFERFYKGRNKTSGSGTGIGLALAKTIIENEGGIITVNSTMHKGTTFTITFPRAC